MATVFVNSGAAGANNGTSWADAYTSLASTNGAAAGDIVKVHKTHSQTGLGANINWSNGTRSNPVQIVCVDKDNSDALSTGAVVEWTTQNLGPQGNIYSYGMTYRGTAGTGGNGFLVTLTDDGLAVLEQCTLAVTSNGVVKVGNSATARQNCRLQNCTIDMSGAGGTGAIFTLGGNIEMFGGTYTIRSTQTNLIDYGTAGFRGVFTGVNFNGTVTNLFSGSTAGCGTVIFRMCKPPTFTNVFGTSPNGYGAYVELDGFSSGTLTVADLNPVSWPTSRGTTKMTTSRYRTGGADDGSQANAYSWEMASNGNAGVFHSPLMSPPITRWVGTGSQTVTIYIASGGTLNDDDVWIEVYSPSEAGSATAQATTRTTRRAALATAAAVTTDGSSTWNGSGVGTKQKLSVTIAPTIPGPLVVRVYLAKASTTIYVDPLIDLAGDVNGKSRFMEGVEQFAATSAGSAGMLYIPNLDGV